MADRDPEFCICSGYDNGYDNNWFAGPFNSLNEARAEGSKYHDDQVGLRIHKVKFSHPCEWLPSLDDMLYQMDEQAHDNGYTLDGDTMHVITDDKKAEAQAAFEAWAEKYIELEIERWAGEEIEKVGPQAP